MKVKNSKGDKESKRGNTALAESKKVKGKKQKRKIRKERKGKKRWRKIRFC